MLLILYVIAMALGRLRGWPPVVRMLPRVDAGFDRLVRQPFKPVLLMVPTVALLWGGPIIPEIDRAGLRLFPSLAAIAYYALFFGFGWWLHRRIQLLDLMRQWLKSYFVVGLLCFLVLGASMQAATAPNAAQHWMAIKLTALTAAALEAWCLTFAVTGLFLRIANGHRPWVRYVADASYWWYLWHLPIVILLQVWIADWAMNGWLKLALMLAVTVAILLPSYHVMVRYTWIGRILNGPRERINPGPATAAPKERPGRPNP
jgi:peptidoglycan/LPS O-acetylase OafA/YrhL